MHIKLSTYKNQLNFKIEITRGYQIIYFLITINRLNTHLSGINTPWTITNGKNKTI